MTSKRFNSWIADLKEKGRRIYDVAVDRVERQVEATPELPRPEATAKRVMQLVVVALTVGLGWSVLARIDVVVPSRGRFEPAAGSQGIQSRTGGVVTAVLVSEGQEVNAGQLLIQLDKTQLLNRIEELTQQREPLVQQLAILKGVRQNIPLSTLQKSGIGIPPELASRVQSRALLVAQLRNDPKGLSGEQLSQYRLFQQQVRDRQAIALLEVQSLRSQEVGATSTTSAARATLQSERELLRRLAPLARQGGISRADFLQRQARVTELENQLNQGRVQQAQATISRLQAEVNGRGTVAELYEQVRQELNGLDREIDAAIEEKQTALIQIDAQLKQARTDLENQDLEAPINGTVFNLGPKLPGLVTQPGQVLAQVTPEGALIMRLEVANRDIASVREGMPVDVRIDAYPFSQFGSVPGRVLRVGSDAIQPQTGQQGQSFFPVEVQLERPYLERGNERFTITPGMSGTGNIKIANRAPISLLWDQVIGVTDNVQTIR